MEVFIASLSVRDLKDVIASAGLDTSGCIDKADLIQRFRNADEAEAGIREMLAEKQIVLGFGHPVYTISDPRSNIIKEYARQLCEEFGTPVLFEIAERIENVIDAIVTAGKSALFMLKICIHFIDPSHNL